MNASHPQQLPGEIYLGETTQLFFNASGWQTKRFGTGGVHRPWFVQASEVQERIQKEKASGDKFAVAVLEGLLKHKKATSLLQEASKI